MLKITAYVRSENSKKVMILEGDRQSFRCRQRNKYINGKFIQYLYNHFELDYIKKFFVSLIIFEYLIA